MKKDVEIARTAPIRPIAEIAGDLGVGGDDLVQYGRDMAKIDHTILSRPSPREGTSRLILVSAITPTPAGEGKTTTSIGLGMAMARLGKSICIALREPSLGPCFGIKGGATGGGYSQLYPAGRINLHFTGDFHAVTSAHNLLAALLDNHIYQGNKLGIDPRRILWRRVLDMNDRALRNVVVGLGGANQGVPRETGFDITAASEVMAMLCLANDLDDLRERIDRTLVAFTYDGEPVTAAQLRGTGSMLALLRDAVNPNLVQTIEGTPVLMHGGPFANIAHGCNSVIATKMALHLADWAITEAGFGFDLGAEKFFDIKCPSADLKTSAVVLVATIRALKMHGGVAKDELHAPDAEAVLRGLPNLEKHIESIREFGLTPIVALNRFGEDTPEELAAVKNHCEQQRIACAEAEHFAKGGEGAEALAKLVIEEAEKKDAASHTLYDSADSIPHKILKVARTMYGAKSVEFTKPALRDLKDVEKLGYEHLPVCIAKTQNSLSDDPRLRGRPSDFSVTVRNVRINAGAGFLVVLTGEMMRMPGLPASPAAEHIDVEDGKIIGIE